MARGRLVWLAPLALAVSAALGLSVGPGGIGFGVGPEIMSLRLARVSLALLAGVGLASSGAALQAVLGNPLAEPYLLGVAGGAALGAAAAILLGLGRTFLGSLATPLLAMACDLAVIYLVYRLSRVRGRMMAESVILAGMVANAFLSGLIMLAMVLAGRQLPEILWLLMGSLSLAMTSGFAWLLAVSSVLVAACSLSLWLWGRSLNLLSLGEAQAQSLGVPVEGVKRRVFLAVALSVAAVVSLCGVIGFVGLMMPHLARMLSGPDNRRLIPTAAAFGASLLMLADAAARTLAPQELPLGVVMAMLGGPFFLYLLWRRKRSQT
jgi:iron complex transport system permease protein